jgi:hypothetical protein
MIDERTYVVTFAGNGNTPKETVERYFLYRCAELTREKGYTYFAILRSSASGDLGDRRYFGQAERQDGLMQVKGSAPSYYYVPGGTTTIRTWTGRATIRMYNRVNLTSPIVGWPAEDVLAQLAPFVKSSPPSQVGMPPPSIIDPRLGVRPLPAAPSETGPAGPSTLPPDGKDADEEKVPAKPAV